MKKTTNQIVSVFRLINTAKISKMEDAEKFAFIKNVRLLKKVATDFEDALRDAQEKLKPDGFNEIAAKAQAAKALSKSENDVLDKYNKDVSDCLSDELEKEIELDFAPLTEAALGRFFASNDFAMNEIMLIGDVLVTDYATENTETAPENA